MSTTNESSVIKDTIKVLLNEAEKVSSRIYISALSFLMLGLLVAAGGVVYFYFSNDALFLDRAFYEEQINKLEADNASARRDNILLAKAYDRRVDLDTTNIRVINLAKDVSFASLQNYASFYNEIIKSQSQKDGDEQLAYIYRNVDKNNKIFAQLNHRLKNLPVLIQVRNEKQNQVDSLLRKYKESVSRPLKAARAVNSYDKPELVFAPKLVYGFFSRLGGLVFIELIAFYLLKQYRVNMNDFKYYENRVRQARINSYLITMVDKLDDEKEKIALVSRFFTESSDSSLDSKQGTTESLLDTPDIESLRKILDSLRSLVGK